MVTSRQFLACLIEPTTPEVSGTFERYSEPLLNVSLTLCMAYWSRNTRFLNTCDHSAVQWKQSFTSNCPSIKVGATHSCGPSWRLTRLHRPAWSVVSRILQEDRSRAPRCRATAFNWSHTHTHACRPHAHKHTHRAGELCCVHEWAEKSKQRSKKWCIHCSRRNKFGIFDIKLKIQFCVCVSSLCQRSK